MKTVSQMQKGTRLTQQGLLSLWRTALMDVAPNTPVEVITKATYGNFIRYAQPLIQSGDLQDVLNYAVENWASICATKLFWVGSKGGNAMRSTPNLEQLGKFAKFFMQAYMDSKAATAHNESKAKVDTSSIVLEETKAALARRDAELRKVKEQLRRTERVAYARQVGNGAEVVEPSAPLTARLESAKTLYAEDSDLPDWGQQ